MVQVIQVYSKLATPPSSRRKAILNVSARLNILIKVVWYKEMENFSSIPTLLYHQLLQRGFIKTANSLIKECPELRHLEPMKADNVKLPAINCPSLADSNRDYHKCKEIIKKELRSLPEKVNYKEKKSLPLQLEKLVVCLKLVDGPTTANENLEPIQENLPEIAMGVDLEDPNKYNYQFTFNVHVNFDT